jgi:hypothetical protein
MRVEAKIGVRDAYTVYASLAKEQLRKERTYRDGSCPRLLIFFS